MSEIDFFGVKLSCKFVAPGLTLHDLSKIFEEAAKDGESWAANPSKWPTNLGILAVVKAVLEAVYAEKKNEITD